MTYSRIPRACTKTNAVVADSQATDSVLVPAQRANPLTTENVPNLILAVSHCARKGEEILQITLETYFAFEVVVTRKKEAARDREANRGNTAKDRFALLSLISRNHESESTSCV